MSYGPWAGAYDGKWVHHAGSDGGQTLGGKGAPMNAAGTHRAASKPSTAA